MKITLRENSFKVTPESTIEKAATLEALRNLTTLKRVPVPGDRRKFKYEPDKRYYLESNGEYYFMDTYYEIFIGILAYNGFSKEDVTFVKEPDYPKPDVGLSLKINPEYRDDQEKYVKHITKDAKGRYLVDLYTGGGKTFIAAAALATLNKRTLILIKPKYINKWVSDLKGYFDLTDNDIVVINSGQTLNAYIEQGGGGKFVILSTVISQTWVSDFEVLSSQSLSKFDYPPTEFLRRCGIGVMLNDETHQHFHSVHQSILAFDPAKVVALSATLITKDKLLNKIYKYLFPKKNWLSFSTLDPYIHFFIVGYSTAGGVKKKNVSSGYGYSHNKFEQFLLRRPTLLNGYFKMIKDLLDAHYNNRANIENKESALIFVSMVEMATKLTEYLRSYSDLDIRRYVGDDPYENLHEPDIVVSTLGSSGTAEDIKKLITVINTVPQDSIQSNIQAQGRLRKEGDLEKRYLQLHCKDIEAHRRYMTQLKSLFHDRVKRIIIDNYPIVLR